MVEQERSPGAVSSHEQIGGEQVGGQSGKKQADQSERSQGRMLQGVVRGSKMNKTVVVAVNSRVLQRTYKKYVSRRKNYLAHDERNEYQPGDIVRIVATRPLSRRKRWRVIQLVERPS